MWDQPLGSRSFREVAAKFIDKSATRSTTSSKRTTSNSNSNQQALSMSSAKLQQSVVEPRAGRVGIFCNLTHIQKELSRPFQITPAIVKRNQLHFGQSVTEWYSALPKAAKGGHGQLKEQVCKHLMHYVAYNGRCQSSLPNHVNCRHCGGMAKPHA